MFTASLARGMVKSWFSSYLSKNVHSFIQAVKNMGLLLSQRNTGADVRAVQGALNFHIRCDLTPLEVDGIFGQKTKARMLESASKTASLFCKQGK